MPSSLQLDIPAMQTILIQLEVMIKSSLTPSHSTSVEAIRSNILENISYYNDALQNEIILQRQSNIRDADGQTKLEQLRHYLVKLKILYNKLPHNDKVFVIPLDEYYSQIFGSNQYLPLSAKDPDIQNQMRYNLAAYWFKARTNSTKLPSSLDLGIVLEFTHDATQSTHSAVFYNTFTEEFLTRNKSYFPNTIELLKDIRTQIVNTSGEIAHPTNPDYLEALCAARSVVIHSQVGIVGSGGYPSNNPQTIHPAEPGYAPYQIIYVHQAAPQLQEAYDDAAYMLINPNKIGDIKYEDKLKQIYFNQTGLTRPTQVDLSENIIKLGTPFQLKRFIQNSKAHSPSNPRHGEYLDGLAYALAVSDDVVLRLLADNDYARRRKITAYSKIPQQGLGFFAGDYRGLLEPYFALGVALALARLKGKLTHVQGVEFPYAHPSLLSTLSTFLTLTNLGENQNAASFCLPLGQEGALVPIYLTNIDLFAVPPPRVLNGATVFISAAGDNLVAGPGNEVQCLAPTASSLDDAAVRNCPQAGVSANPFLNTQNLIDSLNHRNGNENFQPLDLPKIIPNTSTQIISQQALAASSTFINQASMPPQTEFFQAGPSPQLSRQQSTVTPTMVTHSNSPVSTSLEMRLASYIAATQQTRLAKGFDPVRAKLTIQTYNNDLEIILYGVGTGHVLTQNAAGFFLGLQALLPNFNIINAPDNQAIQQGNFTWAHTITVKNCNYQTLLACLANPTSTQTTTSATAAPIVQAAASSAGTSSNQRAAVRPPQRREQAPLAPLSGGYSATTPPAFFTPSTNVSPPANTWQGEKICRLYIAKNGELAVNMTNVNGSAAPIAQFLSAFKLLIAIPDRWKATYTDKRFPQSADLANTQQLTQPVVYESGTSPTAYYLTFENPGAAHGHNAIGINFFNRNALIDFLDNFLCVTKKPKANNWVELTLPGDTKPFAVVNNRDPLYQTTLYLLKSHPLAREEAYIEFKIDVNGLPSKAQVIPNASSSAAQMTSPPPSQLAQQQGGRARSMQQYTIQANSPIPGLGNAPAGQRGKLRPGYQAPGAQTVQGSNISSTIAPANTGGNSTWLASRRPPG